MFVSREPLEAAAGHAPLGLRIAGAARRQQPGNRLPGWARSWRFLEAWKIRCEQRLARLDLAPDLAEEIGSARWFRGLATLLGLSAAALAFLPDFSALSAPPTMPVDHAARAEFGRRTIASAAFGASLAPGIGPGPRVRPVANVPERAIVQLAVTYAQGDSFDRLLQRAGVGPAEAARVSSLVSGSIDPAGLAAGTRIDITLGRRPAPGQPRPLDALSFGARFDLRLDVVRGPGGFVLHQQPIAVSSVPLRIRGTIGAGLYRSARAAGAPIEAIQQYLQVLDQHLSLDTAIEPGDTFDIIVGFKRAATGETRVGELLFAGIERNGRPKAQLLRWGSEGQFFEASGMGAQRSGLIMPVVGRITSSFGLRRHPILGYTRLHGGVDFGAPWGAPIYAVGDATVSFAGWAGGHGNHVKLEHGGGWATGYSHMSRIAVTPGSRVRAGQVIGYVGSTGLSTGPHLHYELYRDGAKVNPMSVRFTVSNQVDAKELAAFRARLAALKAVVPGAALVPGAMPDR